jgi:drug/metabolite transporter (DMT)-like permease
MALIALAAFCWGASATLGKAVFNGMFAHAAPISPLVLAQTRTTFSFLILAPFLAVFARRHFRADRNSLLLALVIGAIGLAGSNFFYYYAIAKTNVSTAIVLQYFAPVWVLLWMVVTRAQSATLPRVFGVALAVLGSALAIGIGAGAGFRVDKLGFLAAEGAGVCFAFYNVAGSRVVKHVSAIGVMLYAALGAALLWSFIDPPWRLARMPFSSGQWWFLVFFAAVSMLIPFVLYFLGLQRLDATSAIVTSCLEPVFAILLAAAFVGESLRPLQVLGIALVIGATALIQLPQRRALGTHA